MTHYMHSSNMKKFIIKIIIFLLCVIIGLLTYEVIIRSCDNDYKFKNSWLSENAKKVKILSLGSSHGFYGISPEEFSLQTFNAGHHAQDLRFDNFIFNKFFPNMDSLRYVILPISYPTPFGQLEYLTKDNKRIVNYVLYYDCPDFPFSIKYNFECCSINVEYLLSILKSHTLRSCNEYGQLQEPNMDTIDFEQFGKERVKRFSYRQTDLSELELDTIFEKNVSYVQDIINKCNIRNVHVILLTIPVYSSYSKNEDEEQWKRTLEFCQQLQNRNNNVSYINMQTDERFSIDDFFDADHLNQFGAAKLSNFLNDYIMNTLEPQVKNYALSIP